MNELKSISVRATRDLESAGGLFGLTQALESRNAQHALKSLGMIPREQRTWTGF
jgi:hypothetical protein